MTPHHSGRRNAREPFAWSWRLLLGVGCLVGSGCETIPVAEQVAPPPRIMPTVAGSFYHVRSGETLWRIAHSYGLDSRTLAAANHLPPNAALRNGQRLFIPLPRDSARFLWPLRGSFRSTHAIHGMEIAAPAGSVVRASRRGRVAVAAHELSGWGKTVVVDHLDGYFTVYAGLEQVLVAPGSSIPQGAAVGNIGAHPLHFEIRYGALPKNPMSFLPNE